MSFADEMARAADDVLADATAVLDVATELAKQSIQFGSPLTGALGQPVDEGTLRNSFMVERPSPTERTIATNLPYAQSIEDGLSYAHGGTPMTLRSAVGGFHSIAQTVANFDRIADAAVEAVGSSRGR